MLEDKYIIAADQFARSAALLGYTVVSGGSRRGLMGVVADVMLERGEEGAGGTVEGVIPSFMMDLELQHPGIKNVRIVESMSERKELMREGSDAVVAFPGGLGTLEEFLETLTLKRLGRYDGVVILFNQSGYYDHLLSLLDFFVSEKTMSSSYRNSFKVARNAREVITLIEESTREFLVPHDYLPGIKK
jgi:uncharacterized protein (TIGR00730 family)